MITGKGNTCDEIYSDKKYQEEGFSINHCFELEPHVVATCKDSSDCKFLQEGHEESLSHFQNEIGYENCESLKNAYRQNRGSVYARDPSQIIEGEFSSFEPQNTYTPPLLEPQDSQSVWMTASECDCEPSSICDSLLLESIEVQIQRGENIASIGFNGPLEIWDFMPKAIQPMQVQLSGQNTFSGIESTHWGNPNYSDHKFYIFGQLAPFQAHLSTTLSTQDFECSNVELNFANITK